MSQPQNVEFKSAIPNMLVADVPAAIAFYVDSLGFESTMEGDNFAMVARGNVALGLISSKTAAGKSWCYITVSDPAQVFEEYQKTGVKILQPLQNWEGHIEFAISDPQGNRLDIGN